MNKVKIPIIIVISIMFVLFSYCFNENSNFEKNNGGSINDIKHVILFMQENRSFDHYFGTLRGVRGFNDRAHAGIQSSKRGIFYQPVSKDHSKYQLPWHVESKRTSASCMDAADMSFETDTAMWNRGKMDSWNTAREQSMGMAYFDREDLPYYYQLADEFTIGDQYYQSTLTETDPNRVFFFTGSNGLSANKTDLLNNFIPDQGLEWETLGEVLDKKGVTWKVFQELENFDDNAFAWFKNYREADKESTLHKNGMSRVKELASAFGKAMDENKLPQVSIFVAPMVLSEHARNHPAAGEDLTARLLNELKKRPEYYKKSVFILNYDEGGQFFDHHWVPTPPTSKEEGVSSVYVEDEIVTDKFSIKGRTPMGMGFRVPLIIVSPWTRGGHVVSEVFDHTSILKFLEIRFDIKIKVLSDWRRAVAGNLLSAFDFDNPDYSFPDLPDTNSYVDDSINQCDTLPKPQIPIKQTVPTQEKGIRPSRILPYDFVITEQIRNNKFKLQIFSKGKAGGAFQLYDWKNEDSVIRKYTVHSGAEIFDEININGEYNFSLHGPNGFVRHFKGNSNYDSGLECLVLTNFDSVSGKIKLSFLNKSKTVQCSFNLKDNAYKLFDKKSNIESSFEIEIDVNKSGNWYDFTVTNNDKDNITYFRRFMGRIERKGNTSDPAIGNEFYEFEKPKVLVDSPYTLASRYSIGDKRNKDSYRCYSMKNDRMCRNENNFSYLK